jgi:hypothetical protein
MDVPLYAIALATFAVLYMALSVWLVWAIVIALILMLAFLSIRYGNVSEKYPHSAKDVSITTIFIGVTWGIFVFLGPKPFPVLGDGLNYAAPSPIFLTTIVAGLVVFTIGFLLIYSFAMPHLSESSRTQGGTTDETGKPKQGVGAG